MDRSRTIPHPTLSITPLGIPSSLIHLWGLHSTNIVHGSLSWNQDINPSRMRDPHFHKVGSFSYPLLGHPIAKPMWENS